MLTLHNNRQPSAMMYAVIALLLLTFSAACRAELSREDLRLITAINTRMASTPNTGVAISIQDGNINLRGVAASNIMASIIITNIAAVPGIKNIDTTNVTLPDGSNISREAIIIGLTRGYLLRHYLFGNKVTSISEMPIRMTGEEGIIYIDGIVNNQYIMTTTLTTAMQVSSRIDSNIRIISRMTIRKVTVRMP